MNNNVNNNNNTSLARKDTVALIRKGMQRRHAAEKRFKLYGLTAISIALLAVVLLFGDILVKGLPAFWETSIRLDIYFDPAIITPEGQRDPQVLDTADYSALWKQSLRRLFPEVQDRTELRSLYALISSGASLQLRDRVIANPALIGTTQSVVLSADHTVDTFVKGGSDRELPEAQRLIKDEQIAWLDRLKAGGRLVTRFNTTFFTSGDSREPEQAGIAGAVVGSLFTLLITLSLSFPIGVAAAVYLEEFAPHNRWTDIIEVNINNLAAVPSIVFGLLGLAVYINFFHLPRSSPLVGGLVLFLMNLPIMIIASRAALKSVPPSVREAALGMGASKLQMVTHHVLPLAMPGIFTGSILAMAHALGESAPLLMIGMIAFIVDIPTSPLQPATVLPVQIYLWSTLPERAFVERTSAAIIILLLFLTLMNATAIILRKRFERRW
jgi:phosphate transport system permease protein